MLAWQRKRNNLIVNIANIKSYLKRGITGDGVKILQGELDLNSRHAGMVRSLAHLCPDAHWDQFHIVKDNTNTSFIAMLEKALDEGYDIVATSLRFKVLKQYRKRIIDLLDMCAVKGILVINSIGNTGDDDVGDNALLHPDIINVGAISIERGQPVLEMYSSRHKAIDCVGIVGYFSDEYGYTDGTSGAVPYIMVIAALYICAYGRISPLDFVKACAVDMNKVGFDVETGHGFLSLPRKNKWSVKFLDVFVHRTYTVYAFKKGYKLG